MTQKVKTNFFFRKLEHYIFEIYFPEPLYLSFFIFLSFPSLLFDFIFFSFLKLHLSLSFWCAFSFSTKKRSLSVARQPSSPANRAIPTRNPILAAKLASPQALPLGCCHTDHIITHHFVFELIIDPCRGRIGRPPLWEPPQSPVSGQVYSRTALAARFLLLLACRGHNLSFSHI